MSTGNRPLSPHLQIYKPQITSVLSILHRMTGVGLALGALMLVYWLNAAAYGPEAFGRAQEFLSGWFGNLLLLGWTWALFYHLCNGVRHMFWDTGRGLELPQVQLTGWLVVIFSVVFTLLSFLAGYGILGNF